jgi:DNA anti-recombination protein RmuC
MTRGRFKAKAESQLITATLKQLQEQVQLLTAENRTLKEQLDQNIQHHAFQIAQMHQHLTEGTAPEIQSLKEENLKLKKAFRGLDNG